MPSQDEFKNKARAQARSVLAKSKTFHALPKNEQMALYSDVVDAELNNLTGKSEQLATAQSTHADEVASNLDATSEGLGDLMDAVDFPTFVGDLLTAVFDANLDVTIKQMNTYRELMQAATGEISKFVKNVDDAESFAYLAENDSDNFSIGFPEEGEGGALKLLDKEGEEVDPSDSEIRAKIMDAKIAMAKEHRAMLRETLLMGITRLVVEKGTIKASVAFNINTKTKTKVGDQRTDTEKRRGVKHTRTSSPWFWPVRTRSAGTTQTRGSTITVSSTKTQSETEMAAQLMGSVEIVFKSDYFKLDNFAQMYGPVQGEDAIRAQDAAQDGAGA